MRQLTPAILALVACGPREEALVDPLPPEAWVVRASLDLRGVRPSLAEIRRVHDDPEAAVEVVRGFVDDPRFARRLADLYAELTLTRTETWPVGPQGYGLQDEVRLADFVRAVGDEPLRVIERVAREDLPWTELVLGDWTMADDLLLRVWPLEAEAGDGWRVARYTDGRPAAGLLSTNALWWRFGSTESNANRGRAAQVTRLFLCVDYGEVAIPFDAELDLLEPAAVEEAIRDNPACASCHDRLDPLAGYLYGFWYVDPNSALDASRYHPERELLYRGRSRLDPALDGEAGFTLRDLGRQLAADPRFPDCAVEQAWRLLLRRRPSAEDDARVRVRNAFLEGGLTARALYRALVTSPTYREAAGAALGVKLASPDLLASQVEDLTGFRLVDGDGWDLMTADLVGLRSLAGGADGVFSTANADLPNATVVLVQERLAEAAAAHVVAHDRGSDDDRLLGRLDFTETPARGREVMVAQLVDLHARIFGRAVAPDGPEVGANLELWQALYELDPDPAAAWAGVVTALLRDPDLLLY